MSSWGEERRQNLAAAAEQDRINAKAASVLRREEREAEDQRKRELRAADREERRREKRQSRRDRADRRAARMAKWTKSTTPANVYRRGTLALVVASALAALPAQIAYFTAISIMLLPVPFALEGAAWVMAAGVAYADDRKLPIWVRWLLRALSMAAAGFAARINYLHGSTSSEVVGWGLAAVTMLGPAFFEIRQWVSTLSPDGAERQKVAKVKADAKAKATHAKRRAKDHKEVVEIAGRLMSAATYGSLAPEDAFQAAHEIVYGTRTPGMTPTLCVRKAEARQSLAEALSEVGMTAEEAAIDLFLADLFGPGSDGDGNPDGTPGGGPQKGPQGSGDGSSRTASGGAPEGRTALGRKGKRGFGRSAPKVPDKPLAEADLVKVRKLADALGNASKLSLGNVRSAVGGGNNQYLVRLRDAVRDEHK